MPSRTSFMKSLMQRRKMMEAGDPIAAGQASQGREIKKPSVAASAAGLGRGRKKKKKNNPHPTY